MAEKTHIMAIDCGSTGIRALIFNKKAEIIERAYEKVEAMYPKPGWIENNPRDLVEKCIKVVKQVLQKVPAESIAAIGITNQRASFLLWDKETGEPIINIINWADVRAAEVVAKANKEFKWKLLQNIAKIGKLFGNPMLTVTTMLQFTTDHATMRLRWALENIEGLRAKCESGKLVFGTIESWLIYNLTGKKVIAMEASNASSTGLFNPFKLQWNKDLCSIQKIPMNILPEVKDSADDFGETDPSLFGVAIPIRGAAGDQQAALFGQCCFNPGDVKISQGSGAFVDMNVGDKPLFSKRGLFPLLGWRINGKPTFILEGYMATAGTLIDWLGKGLGLSQTPDELNELANSVEDTNGVVFVPAPNGLRFPYFDPYARLTVVGVSLSTKRAHVARAVLEGFAFNLTDIITGMAEDTKIPIKMITVDGGVSRSSLLLQMISNLSNTRLERAKELDMTGTGAAFLAGLQTGFWKFEELRSLKSVASVYEPKISEEEREKKKIMWEDAVSRSLNWRYE